METWDRDSAPAVRLSPFSRRHVRATCQWVNRPELKHFTGTLFPVSKHGHNAWARRLREDPLRLWFAIELDGVHVGNTGVKHWDKAARCAELFVYIAHPSDRTQGMGREATRQLVTYCFETLNLHKVFAQVFAFNDTALAMYAKAGFVQEARLREHYYHGGRWHDQIVLSLLNNGLYGS